MSRTKSIFAVLLLTAFVGIVPQAQAQTLKVVIAGSSALWQTLALGAFGTPTSTPGQGTCGTALTGCTSPTFHWTSAKSGSTEPYLNDSRGTGNQDAGPIWVVWDSASTPNVWIFSKVDSVVGDRCYFAKPACQVVVPSGASNVGSNLIGVWDNSACGTSCDTNLPASIQSILTNGTPVTVAATDIRPEDAAWAAARVNSKLGASTYGGTGSDGLDGLGYNTNNASGVPAVYPAGVSGIGTPIKSGQPLSTQQANVVAFNITGKDPFTNTAIPAFTVTPVGAAPIVFVNSRSGTLANLANASETQLQQVLSGGNCDASAFGLPSGGINIFLREPLSGTYNTVESNIARRPTVYTLPAGSNTSPVLGVSQETNVGAITASSNPLVSTTPGECISGAGARYRAIGTSEEVNSVLYTNNTSNCSTSPCYATPQDGIGYAFFSYGNVKAIAGTTSFGYITLDGVDPIFAGYGTGIDPGEPSVAGELPLNTPCGTGSAAFPCDEAQIWANGFSFPNVRNGTYRAWSLLRLVSNGTPSTNAANLVKASQAFVVSSVPDYVPYTAVTCSSCNGTGVTISDLGLKLLRSHYEQRDGNGNELGKTTAIENEPTENGGDMGGLIIPTAIGVTTEKQLQIVQSGTATNLSPVARPQ